MVLVHGHHPDVCHSTLRAICGDGERWEHAWAPVRFKRTECLPPLWHPISRCGLHQTMASIDGIERSMFGDTINPWLMQSIADLPTTLQSIAAEACGLELTMGLIHTRSRHSRQKSGELTRLRLD